MTPVTPTLPASTAMLHYYLLQAGGGEDTTGAGLLVEEFVLDDDLSAVRLRGACWTAADAGWWSSAAFVRAVRTDRRLRSRLTAVNRPGAEAAYGRLGGGTLPDEDTLRRHFSDDVPLAAGAPLRLGTGPAVHRVLFAGEPDGDAIARLSALLRLGAAPGTDVTEPGVVGTGRLRVNDTNHLWRLRRVGGVAWSIDVTSDPAGGEGLRWVLRQLTDVARGHGLVPTTIERLS
ncbi:hypothetical protein ACSNN9_02590 [Micromonospora sp. URMC 107]|uniref:hypothetical protein n=1 Tax=Micromonospora sp. URMC 107 TaxID=3423418 RepID=UPI003F1B02C4